MEGDALTNEQAIQQLRRMYDHQEQLNATIESLRTSLDEMRIQAQTQQQLYNSLRSEVAHNQRNTLGEENREPGSEQWRSIQAPSSVQPAKAILPNVEVFESGTHEQYLQWKMKARAKLYGDRAAFPTEELQVQYLITRTNGRAFNALSPYVDQIVRGTTTPTVSRLWSYLDTFFEDPTARAKALEYLRTTKQGTQEFNQHVQNFNLKLQEAGMDNASDAQKIDYLRNSLATRLLKAQIGYQPAREESYDEFINRSRVTWENLKAVDRITSGKKSYGNQEYYNPHRGSNEMDWTPTVGSHQPRTRKPREYWGTEEEIQDRRESGACLRCGQQGHRVRECRKKAPLSPQSRTAIPKPYKAARVAAVQPTEDSSSSGEEGKE